MAVQEEPLSAMLVLDHVLALAEQEAKARGLRSKAAIDRSPEMRAAEAYVMKWFDRNWNRIQAGLRADSWQPEKGSFEYDRAGGIDR